MGFLFAPSPKLVDVSSALPGRPEPVLANPREHAVLGTPTTGPWREGQKRVLVGIGCFWGAEKMFWQLDGVNSTSVGYAGGVTPNPTYREVCSGQTNHVETVEVVYDPEVITLKDIVKTALEAHDPTQGYRQGNISVDFTPVLMLDMWEHAFYLQYKNVKADYVEAWWNVVNWDDVNERYAKASA